MMNVADTVIRQYAAAGALKRIIYSFNDAVSIDDFIESFITEVWDVRTAGTYGLNVWGKIVGVSRLVTVEPSEDYFGFDEASSSPAVADDPQPFNQAPFYTAGTNQTSTVSLTNDVYRKLILVKAAANITDCSIPSLNRLLVTMFGDRGRAYVRNDGSMEMSYVFEFALTPAELSIVRYSGAFPAPAGVTVNIVQQV